MANEYKIKWHMPKDYMATSLLQSLPSPISQLMIEIYNYSILEDGFYFLDNLVDDRVAGYAFKLFINEALSHTSQVEVYKL